MSKRLTLLDLKNSIAAEHNTDPMSSANELQLEISVCYNYLVLLISSLKFI